MIKFQKTLIVEQNREYVVQIREFLDGLTGEVEFCFDGYTAQQLYDRFRPDLILVEAILPKLDGFALMEHILEDNIVKVMLTSINQDIIIKKAFCLKADYLFVKPYQREHFRSRLIEVAEYRYAHPYSTAPQLPEQAMWNKISSTLKVLGIPANFKGYSYLREALMIVCRDFSALNSLNNNVYKNIAEEFDTTEKSVERNIRHAIEVSAVRGDMETYYNFFGYSIDSNKGKPTNGEFIAALADKMMQ